MQHGKRCLIFVPILLFLVLLATVSGSVLALDSKADAKITSVTVSPEQTHMELQATLTGVPEKTLIYLFALAPGEVNTPLDSLIPIATARASNHEIHFRFYISGNHAHRLYAKYQLAVLAEDSYKALGDGRYFDTPEQLATVTEAYPKAVSKKGLQTQLYTDAQLLGVAHTIVPLAINELLTTKESPYSFVYLDQTYYLDQGAMELLDYKIRRLSQAGIRVYLNLLLTAPSEENSQFSDLYYETNSAEAQFFAYNQDNENSVHLLQGLLRYLTARYTRADRAYGFVASFIVGYEVNASRFRNYRGLCTLNEYAASYARLIRVVYTATRTVYADARVYISIANNWNTPSIDPTVTVNPLLDYSAYDFLVAFNSAMSAQGDPIPWSVAINPYPSDVTMTDFWNDENAPTTPDAPYLTMKNIEVLTDLLASHPFSQGGKARTVLISEFGVSGELGTETESLQAAAFAYAYYKTVSIRGIEALIWHRQVDRIGENNLYYGLWSSDYSDILAPVAKKQIYNIFRYIDVNRMALSSSEDLTAFAPSLIGEASWDTLISGFSASEAKVQHLYETVPTTPASSEGKMHVSTVYDFSDGNLYSFYPSDSARYLETRADDTYGSILYTSLYPTDPTEYAGIASYRVTPLSIAGQSYLQIILKAAHGTTETETGEEANNTAEEPISLMLRMTGTNENGIPCTYEGAAQIASGEWTTITFPISTFSSAVPEITGMRIWIRGHENEQSSVSGECYLAIASVSLLTPSRFSILRLLIQIIIGITIPVALLFVGYLISLRVRASIRKAKKKSHRSVDGMHRYHVQGHVTKSDSDHEDPDSKP